MTRKRESSPNGQRKLSKPKVPNANARPQKRNKMEVANIDDSVQKKSKTRTSTHVALAEDVSGSQVSDQSSIRLSRNRGKTSRSKLDLSAAVVKDTKLIKNSEELVNTVPLATVGHHSHVNKLHRKRRVDSQSASSSSLAAAVTEAREGLGNKCAIAPIQTLNQPDKTINKQSAKRKVARRIVKIKGLGRKERKFINNLQSYRDQPSIVTRLKEVNVVKPKPRKRTLSGEFELLDEGLLRKQIKFDEALLSSKKAFHISKSSKIKLKQRKKLSVKTSKQADGMMADKPLKKRIVGKIKHHTFMNKGVTKVDVDPNERQLVSNPKLKTKRVALRKLQSSEVRKITRPMFRKVKNLETQSNEQEAVKKKTKRKKKTLTYADPPILFAEPHNSDSLDTSHFLDESDDQEVSFKDKTTVASSPPPILEKAVDPLDVALPLKRKRGRPKLVSKKADLTELKTNVQVGAADVESTKTQLTEESKTEDFKGNETMKDEQFQKRKGPKEDGFIVRKKRKNLSRTVTGLFKKKVRVKQEVGLGNSSEMHVQSVNIKHVIKLKNKRCRGTYDFPGKKKQKQSTERKSDLFFEVNNVRAGKQKPKNLFTVTNVDSDMEIKDKKLIATKTIKKDLSLMEKASSTKGLIEKRISNESELSMTSDLLSDDSMSNRTTEKPVLNQEIIPCLIADSDNDSDLDLPLVSFIKKKTSSSVDEKFKSTEHDISSSDIPTIPTDVESPVLEKCVLPKLAPTEENLSYHFKTAVSEESKSDVKCFVSSSADISCSSVQILPTPALVSMSKDEKFSNSNHADTDKITVDSQSKQIVAGGVHVHSVIPNSEHSQSVTSNISFTREIKDTVFNDTPSQNIGMSNGEQIQPISVHSEAMSTSTDAITVIDHKLKSGVTEQSSVVQLNTDSFDGGNKSEDANNNAGDVQAKPTLVVPDGYDMKDYPIDDTVKIPSPCVVDSISSDADLVLGNSFTAPNAAVSDSVSCSEKKQVVHSYDPVTHLSHDDTLGQSGDNIATIASKDDICVLDSKDNGSKPESQPITSQSLDVHSEHADATILTNEHSCPTEEQKTPNLLLNNKSTEESNLCSDSKEKTSFSKNPVLVSETTSSSPDADISVTDGESSKEQEKLNTIEAAGDKWEQHHQLPSNPSAEVAGLKVKLTKNKGSYKISVHSQSTGSESDETLPVMEQEMTASKSDMNNVKVDEQDVFSDSSITNTVEEQNTSIEDVPDSDNRRVPPLKIKFKTRVTKPVRQFALRPKLSRSPIEIIAMKQRKIEEEYQKNEAYRLARRLEKQITKRKLLHQAKLAAESKMLTQSHVPFSNIDEMLALCKPCCVTLVDFVKQLHLGKSEMENSLAQTGYASHVHGEKPKGIKLKIKNISKQPKIVGKRGRPPKLKPRQPVSTSPINVTTDIYIGKEKRIEELNEEGFAGSFVEFLKKNTESNNVHKTFSTIQKNDPSQTIEKESSHTIEKYPSQITEKYPSHTAEKDLSQITQKDPSQITEKDPSQITEDLSQTTEDLLQTIQKDPSTTVLDSNDVIMHTDTIDSQQVSIAKYCCKTCDFTTPVKQTIELHVYRHIPDILFKCGYCDSDFASMASACAHAKNEHVAQESNILKSREIIESDHYFAVEDVPPLEKDPSQTASGQMAADGSTPVVINVVVKGNVALSTPGYSVPSKRFICTHCKYSTNVKGDINQHALDLHASDHVYICTLCSESFYKSEQEMANHCSSTHPSRPCPYRRLPSYYDIEQLKNAQKMKQDDRGNIFERMTNLFQASPSVDENQPEEVVREQHYQRAREFLYIQEGWMRKTSAEADSTTRDTENLMDMQPTDVDEEQQVVSTEALTETDALVESLKPVDIAQDLVYQEQQADGDLLHDDSGISELKIIDVVSLRDQQHIMDESLSESPLDTTEPVHQHTEQIMPESVVQKPETITHNAVGRSSKTRSNVPARCRSSNLPEIDVDAIVQRNERLTCTYKCQKCNIHSPYLSAMVEHLKNHHTDIELFTCPYCKGSRGKRPQFSSELSVHEHVKMIHPTNFAKNEVSLSDAAKEFVQVIAIPSGAECSKVGNTFVIEKDIYMCLRCQAHMPSLDYTFSHLEREHTEVFVYVCPHCKIFKDKTDEIVFKHIFDSHNLEITDDSLPLAIEDNLFIRVPSISKSGSYSERVQGNRNSHQKADKAKLALSKMESNSQKVTTEAAASLSKPLSIGHAEKRKIENVNKSVRQTLISGAGPTSTYMTNKSKTTNRHHTNRVNPRKQADPSHALMMDCESIDDPVVCDDDDIDDICNEDVQIVSCEPAILNTSSPSSGCSAAVSNVRESISKKSVSIHHGDKTGATLSTTHLSNLNATSNTQSPGVRSSLLPLNKISSINQCAPRLKSSIYSIADRLHRLHSQNKANDKSGSSGDHSSSSSPVPISRAVLKVPSVPLRNSTPITLPQTVTSQSLSNVASGSDTVSARVASPTVSAVQKHKSLLFSNCPLDLSAIPFTQNTASSVEQLSTTVTSPMPPAPSNKDTEELRPESFQIFNLKPKRKSDSPQVLPPRAVQQHTISPTAHAAAATILSSAQQVHTLQPIHQAYPLAQLTQMPFQQVPIRFGLGMPNFIATGQPTLITLRQPMIGPRVVQDLVNFQRMAVPQQALQIQQQQQQTLRVSKAHTPDPLRSSDHAVSGIDTKGTQPNVKHQRPASHGAPVSQPPKYVSSTFNNTSVRQQLLQQAEFYCPYCSEFRPLREYEVLPHIQRSHPRKEVLYLRREKL